MARAEGGVLTWWFLGTLTVVAGYTACHPDLIWSLSLSAFRLRRPWSRWRALAVAAGELEARQAVLQLPPVGEAALLSTCNRVEIYASLNRHAPEVMAEAIEDMTGLGGVTWPPCPGAVPAPGGSAVHHMPRVAAS